MLCCVSFKALAVVAGCGSGHSSARAGSATQIRRPASAAALHGARLRPSARRPLSGYAPERSMANLRVCAATTVLPFDQRPIPLSGVGQGDRANRLFCDEVGEVVVVPCGNLSPE